MTQEERWLARYNEVMDFIVANKRNPSKYYAEERNMHNFVKVCRKRINSGEMKETRVSMFKELLENSEKYRRVNQYV